MASFVEKIRPLAALIWLCFFAVFCSSGFSFFSRYVSPISAVAAEQAPVSGPGEASDVKGPAEGGKEAAENPAGPPADSLTETASELSADSLAELAPEPPDRPLAEPLPELPAALPPETAPPSEKKALGLVNGSLVWPGESRDWPGKAPTRPLAGKEPVLDPVWIPLAVRLAENGFPLQRMLEIFAALGPNAYSPAFMAAKVSELHRVNGIGLAPVSDEACILVPEGYLQPLTDTTVGGCRAFAGRHADIFKAIQAKYGVSADIIIAILLVETGCGANLGDDSALRALASMSVADSPKMLAWNNNKAQTLRIKESTLKATLAVKSAWAYNELKSLILYAETNNLNPAAIPGSIYGAIGLCQFMPSNIVPYGVDGDNDGKVDLFGIEDALHSVANYLEAHGWRGAKTAEQRFAVILQYNQDSWYASTVLGVADQLGQAFAGKGKISDKREALAGFALGFRRPLDPSLPRRPLRLPETAKVKSLGTYDGLLD